MKNYLKCHWCFENDYAIEQIRVYSDKFSYDRIIEFIKRKGEKLAKISEITLRGFTVEYATPDEIIKAGFVV